MRWKDTSQNEGVKQASSEDVSHAKRQLLAFLESQAPSLLGAICVYVQNLTPFQREGVYVTALEIMQEVVIEALDHADRYDPTRYPMAWFLGIAVNIIRRKKKKLAENQRRELPFSQLAMSYPEFISQDELLDSLTSSTQRGPEQIVEDDEQVRALLSLVSADDQHLLRLAFLEDCERDTLAQHLGTTPAAARVRLHRALGRLRTAWYEHLEGESNA